MPVTTQSPLIRLDNLTKTIGTRTILDNVSLVVPRGRFVALFGPNGAGKSTLLRVLSLLTPPSSGTISFEGQPVTEEQVKFRERIGLLSHKSFLYDNLSAAENLLFFGRMYGVEELEDRVDTLIDRVGLDLFRNDPVRTFSRGMQQRLAIARAILHKPDVLLLDEPYTGLDQLAAEVLEDTLRDFKGQGASCIIVSHNFERGLALADDYVVLHRGRVDAQGRATDIGPVWLRERFRDYAGVRSL